MHRDSLLILGSGRHQSYLIQLAEKQGYATVIADNQPGSPGRAFCTIQSMVSTTDLDDCRQLAINHNVCGILTCGTDQPVKVMATLSAELGLPCYISPEGGEIATDKPVQRRTLAQAGVPQPRFLALESSTESTLDWDIFPCVVKPADSQGQRGVKRVNDRSTLEATIRDSAKFASKGGVIIEEFIEGPEITATAWMHDGSIHFLALADRITYSAYSLGVAYQHVFPSRAAAPYEAEIRDMIQRIANATGMTLGPLYVQILISPTGPVLVEFGARIGGGHEANMLPLISGFDPLSSLLNTLHQTPFVGSEGPTPGVFGSINFVFTHPGKVASLGGLPPQDQPGILGGEFYTNPGATLSGMVDGQGRSGFFLATGASRSETESNALAFYQQLQILDEQGQNLLLAPAEEELSRPSEAN